MSGDFEKNISQRMEGFRISPDPQLWERVAAALPAKKRRRRFGVWWLLPLAACLAGGVWLMVDREKKKKDDESITNTAGKMPVEDGSSKKIIKLAPVDTINSYTSQQDDKQKSLIRKKQISDQHKTDPSKKELATSYRKHLSRPSVQRDGVAVAYETEKFTIKNVLLKRHTEAAGKRWEDLAYRLNNQVGNVYLQNTVPNDSFFLNKASILPMVDSATMPLAAIVAKYDTASLKQTDTLLKNSVDIKAPNAVHKNKKPEWSLMIAVGKSSLTNGTSDNNKYRDSYYQNTSGGLAGNGNGIGNSNAGTFSNPKGGFNFSAGIERSQTISKQLNWRSELSYQLLTSKQRTGSRNDSLVQFDAFTSRAFYTANRVANMPGIIRLNQVHRLQIASGIGYTPDPAANSPIGFFAGISVAYNVGNNLLLHDHRSNSYIRSATLSNKFMLGGEAAIDVFINHTIHARLLYQHDFTNVGRAKVGSVFRWNQLQLRVGIPVSKQ